MAFTTPGTAVAGDVLTAAFYNVNVRDNLNAVGSILLASTTFSASSGANFNNVFSASFANYEVTCNVTAFSANTDFSLRLRTGGVDTATSYQYALNGVRTNGATAVVASGGDTKIFAGFVRQGVGAPTRHATELSFLDPFAVAETKVGIRSYGDDGASISVYSGAGFNTASTSFDGFTLFPAAGTFSGTIRVYGLRGSF